MWPVLSTMMDVPLTVTGLMRYGTTVYGDSEVVTCTTDGVRRQSYAQTGARAAQLAGALRELGVDGDQRVATLMWNNAEHLEAYLAVPSMGAVLHTLNLRLDHKQLSYIANHAGDHVIITEPTLVPLLAALLPSLETVRHIVLTGPPSGEGSADAGALVGRGHEVHYYEELLAAEPATFSWPELDERAAAAMCYTSGTTGLPKGVVYSHRSTYLHAMGACLGNAFALSDTDRVLPVVPMFHANAWGLAYAALLSGADLIMPDRFLHPEPLARLFCTVEGRVVGDSSAVLPSDGVSVGEVEVRGPWITGSYYKDDDPAKFHDGWLRTGDVGTMDERGFIRLTDRAKDVIKSGGEWISSMELENALMAHPDVAEAAVIGVADDKWGERPLAAVVIRPGAEVTAEKLRAFMTEQIPRWQLPERWS